jgi:hypothetical protein
MNFLVGRDGNISIIRVGSIAAILGIIFVVGGILLFFVDRASHQVPYDIEPYPGAVKWGEQPQSSTSRRVIYRIQGATIEDVAAYYQKKLTEVSAGDACLRSPPTGNYDTYDGGDRSIPPYRFYCMFDRSGFQITQYTRVNIEPGVESNESVGMILVEYAQNWQG